MEADPTLVKDIAARIRAFQGRNLPKGLPASSSNTGHTDYCYPLVTGMPVDSGWGSPQMVQGNGHGPALGSEDAVS